MQQKAKNGTKIKQGKKMISQLITAFKENKVRSPLFLKVIK